MVDRFQPILMLTVLVGHLVFGCACQHARAAVDDVHRSDPSKPAVASMTIATACALCGEHGDSAPHPCEDNCCTFVKSLGVPIARLTLVGLFPPVRSLSLVAVCRPERGQMQNADTAPAGRPLSVRIREWLASWQM